MNFRRKWGENLDGGRRFDYSQRRLGWRGPGLENVQRAFREGVTPGCSAGIYRPEGDAFRCSAAGMA